MNILFDKKSVPGVLIFGAKQCLKDIRGTCNTSNMHQTWSVERDKMHQKREREMSIDVLNCSYGAFSIVRMSTFGAY